MSYRTPWLVKLAAAWPTASWQISVKSYRASNQCCDTPFQCTEEGGNRRFDSAGQHAKPPPGEAPVVPLPMVNGAPHVCDCGNESLAVSLAVSPIE
jgi:hypothetical protein